MDTNHKRDSKLVTFMKSTRPNLSAHMGQWSEIHVDAYTSAWTFRKLSKQITFYVSWEREMNWTTDCIPSIDWTRSFRCKTHPKSLIVPQNWCITHLAFEKGGDWGTCVFKVLPWRLDRPPFPPHYTSNRKCFWHPDELLSNLQGNLSSTFSIKLSVWTIFLTFFPSFSLCFFIWRTWRSIHFRLLYVVVVVLSLFE